VKKRSRTLPLSPWLGHEKEREWVGQMQGQEQGKSKKSVLSIKNVQKRKEKKRAI